MSGSRQREAGRREMGEGSGPLPGVSIVICVHNGARRLPATLAHLAAQVVPDSLPWEVLLVDNASTDGTSECAVKAWPPAVKAPLVVLKEPAPGKTNALETAWQNARYPIVLIVDDDNWLEPDYVFATASIFAEAPEVAVTNGYVTPEFETPAPEWFSRFHSLYAVSDPAWPDGDVTAHSRVPFGAGMGIRKAAVDELRAQGFRSLLRGRVGGNLMAGEDSELCTALRLGGWRWWRDRRLRLRHFMPAGRLNWTYCRRLARGGGAAASVLDLYEIAVSSEPLNAIARRKETGPWLVLRALREVLGRLPLLARSFLTAGEGDPNVVWMETRVGRLLGACRYCRSTGAALQSLRSARWMRRTGTAPGGDARLRPLPDAVQERCLR